MTSNESMIGAGGVDCGCRDFGFADVIAEGGYALAINIGAADSPDSGPITILPIITFIGSIILA